MEDIEIETKNRLQIIRLNRPKKRNSITSEMYIKIANILKSSAENPEINAVVITGKGDYYCGGTNLELNPQSDSPEDGLAVTREFVSSIINFPKLLIGFVNGPSIGIGVTTLGLFDLVYAVPTATFNTPFVNLGLCAEGCSSFTFPQIMGRATASRVLLLGEKITAQEALNSGLVTEIVSKDKIWSKLEKISQLPMKTLMTIKNQMTENYKNKLNEVNVREFKTLAECLSSDDFINAIMKFASKNSKSKL